jgi:hypothetical protein
VGVTLNREACERRVYRLATLLTGNRVAATRAIQSVIDVQPDLRKLDSAHMDRLTVLRSREIEAATLVDDQVPHRVAAALASLERQQREAWVFARIYRLAPREAAKAMDCSVTAASRHLERADDAIRAALGDQAGEAAESLVRFSMSLDVPEFYRKRRALRRRLRWGIRLIVALLVFVIVVAAFLIVRALVERYVPLGGEDEVAPPPGSPGEVAPPE